jgi:glycosyltransferase involved in cell wall biosynthesis
MKISIAMATYNGENYVLAQLQSFVNQSRQPDEVVITDDCSTDNTVALIEEFAKTAPFDVRVSVNDKNLGYAGNFNAALLDTTGDLVFLSDQDDVWYPNKIWHMVSLAEKNPDFFIYMNDALLTDGELNSVNLTKYGQIKTAGLSDELFVMGCCCAIRREFLDIVLPIPANLKAHDNWLVEIADGLDAKLIEPTVLQYYRRHDNNVSQSYVNLLNKANKFTVYLQVLKSTLKINGRDNFVSRKDQLQFFINGLENLMPKLSQALELNFKSIIETKKEQLELLNKRLDIRQSNFFNRFLKVSKLFRNGYPKKTRFKNSIRDILGL